jgi:hypothetical protein
MTCKHTWSGRWWTRHSGRHEVRGLRCAVADFLCAWLLLGHQLGFLQDIGIIMACSCPTVPCIMFPHWLDRWKAHSADEAPESALSNQAHCCLPLLCRRHCCRACAGFGPQHHRLPHTTIDLSSCSTHHSSTRNQ